MVSSQPHPDRVTGDARGRDDVKYYGGHLIGESMAKSDIRRACACVNAYKGITTEVLESHEVTELRPLAKKAGT